MVALNPVYDVVSAIASCLCQQIKDTVDLPGVCFCGIVPGDMASAAYSGDCEDENCGMAWVRLVTMYPSKIVGQQDNTAGNCGSGLGIDLELGIMRCFDASEEVPSPEVLLAAAQLQYEDALVMQRAIYCCSAVPNKSTILSAYTPLGPDGGLVGGSMVVSIGV